MSDQEAQQQLLEQFTLLAKSLKGRAVVGVIQQALGSKRIFVFAELLSMPNVQALAGTEHEPYLKLLELFCFGRCSDYRAAASLPELSEAQTHKLRLLSTLSLCREQRELGYDALAAEVGAETTRELEDIIIDAIYLGLVSGKMDQRARVFKVSRAASRDVRLGDVGPLTERLEQWARTANALAEALDQNRELGLETRRQEDQHAKEFQAGLDELKAQLKEQATQDKSGPGFDFPDANRPLRDSRRMKRSRIPFT